MEVVALFLLYCRTNFNMPGCNGSLHVTIQPNAEYRLFRMAGTAQQEIRCN
jgi:hypothetical protein